MCNKKKTLKYILIILLSFFGLITLFTITFFVMYQPVEIEGTSMEPQYIDSELYLSNRLLNKPLKYKRGDVIIYRSRYLDIARVIGLPGDRFVINREGVYLNGKLFEEPYLSEGRKRTAYLFRKEMTVVVPQGEYFVMVDKSSWDNYDNNVGYPHDYGLGFTSETTVTGKVAGECNNICLTFVNITNTVFIESVTPVYYWFENLFRR